jgi:predicted nucleic acid-binding protein
MGPVVTTDWILTEIADGLSSARSRAVAVRLIELIRSDSNTTLVRADAALFDRGLTLYASRPDKDWSLTDCVSFTVMNDQGLTDALTFDHHFEQAGFRVLLKPDSATH